MNRQEFEKYIEQGGKLFVVLEPDNYFKKGEVVELRRDDGTELPSFYYPNREKRDLAVYLETGISSPILQLNAV